MSFKVFLIGDSIIDNVVYVMPPGQSVLGHLFSLEPDWDFNQRAIDGDTTVDVLNRQLDDPIDAPAVLSIGGNDLLRRLEILTSQDRKLSVDLLEELHAEVGAFQKRHKEILSHFQKTALICTIYNPVFSKDPELEPLQQAAEVVIALFNDVIQQNSRRAGFDLLELRDIFTEEDDFANPIEPSDQGGLKLAKEIVKWAGNPKGR